MRQMLVLSVVWVAFVFYPESATCMAVDIQSDDMYDSSVEHSRSRRAVLTSHQVVVSASPFLTNSYYFDRNELITFKIRMAYNGSTGTSYTAVKVLITSDWIDLTKTTPVPDQFDSQKQAGDGIELTVNTLAANEVKIANVSGIVKPGIGPLSRLELKMSVSGNQDINNFAGTEFVSSPTVFGVFPDVNVTGLSSGQATVHSDVSMEMSMILPALNYSLLVELTTNIEDLIFMKIKSATVSHKGSAIGSNLASPVQKDYSSQMNNEIDRLTIDFGNITVGDDTTPDADRTITITYDVEINDHELLENGTTRYFGAGIQAGNSVLWVDQTSFVVEKDEPALTFEVTCDQATNGTRLFIGDEVVFNVKIEHNTNTSSQTANAVTVSLLTELLTDDGVANAYSKNVAGSNATYMTFDVGDIGLGSVKEFQLKFKVVNTDDVSPLLEIAATMYLNYKNANANPKRTMKQEITGLMTGTPTINYYIAEPNGTTVAPGQKMDFMIEILMVRMRSPIQVELVMPKTEDRPIASITEFGVESVGSNLNVATNSPSPTDRQTTSDKSLTDQSVINLGQTSNKGSTTDDVDANKIKIKFTAYFNDHSNVTEGAAFWIGAGVIARPKMVWVGQVKLTTTLKTPSVPYPEVNMTVGDTDEFVVDVSVGHDKELSQAVAYNVSFEYYLPPFIAYESDASSSTGISKVLGQRFKIDKEMFYFNDAFTHAINVKLDRPKSPKTGTVEFAIPVRVSFQNRDGEWKEYFRAAKRTMEVLPRTPTIPKSSRAKAHYYGRGFYLNPDNGDFYVCMNQHVATAIPACYQYHPTSELFRPMDHRIGCMLGKSSTDQEFYALARNQITVLKLDGAKNKWKYIPDKAIPDMASFSFQNTEDANKIGVEANPPSNLEGDHNNIKWQATGDGLWRKSGGDAWVKKADWFVNTK
eukprot:TCONS_00054793-protein